jgi:hypothetical protein
MMLFSFVAIAFICVCHGQPPEQFAVPLIDNQQAPLTAMIDTSKITTHIAKMKMLSSGMVLNMSRTTNENDEQCAVSKFTNYEINSKLYFYQCSQLAL